MFHIAHILSLALIAGASGPATPPDGAREASGHEQTAGLRVVVDPATGEIIDNPTSLELERLEEGVRVERRRSSWELREFYLSEGGSGVALEGWADHSLEIEIGPDGAMRTVCSQGDTHASEPDQREEDR